MSGSTTSRSVMIYNEQTKLLANALDRASTAVGIGGIFPLIDLAKPPTGQIDSAAVILFAGSVVVFGFWSIVLHLAARRVLRGLR
jgi:hypothetical protein